MSTAPASGERNAIRGYLWQYDHVARLAYDALLDDDFVRLRLTDPEVGRVDDAVLVRRTRVDGYQFKSADPPRSLTLAKLLAPGRTPSGAATPSLWRSLTDGWTRLGNRYGPATVHLVSQDRASTNDHLGASGAVDRPSPDHFYAFQRSVLRPLQTGTLDLEDVPSGWRHALQRLQDDGALTGNLLEDFLRSVVLETDAGSPLPEVPSTRRADVMALSDALFRLVANASDVVLLDRAQMLALVGWEDRPRLRSPHDFPVDLDTYEPLRGAINELDSHLSAMDGGYIAVLGPPGSGKSTLLSQSLSGRPDRVVRYYAFVPGIPAGRARLAGHSFLHDLVVMLTDAGLVASDRQLPGMDVNTLRRQFVELLDAASQEFRAQARRTIVVIDGLDHVERDHPGVDNLLGELPPPAELPPGVLIVVGSRTLSPLHARARALVEERGTAVNLATHRLPRPAVLDVCRRASATAGCENAVHVRIAELSDGHPLALSYLINRLVGTAADEALSVLESAPSYSGDIAGEYQAVWDGLESEPAVVEVLATCARLRVSFALEWVETWAANAAMHLFRHRVLYLFTKHHDGWRFFHDSFRQFAIDRTGVGLDGRPSESADARVHARIADRCFRATRAGLQDEELYHRWASGDEDTVLRLAEAERFRTQLARFRPSELIHADAACALRIAAGRVDPAAMLRLLLCLVELRHRSDTLDDVDMPRVLHDAGLVDEAIGYCGVDVRRVPLSQAYGLAATLGRAGDAAGRRIFDLVEHDGLDDRESRVSGQEDTAARAWGRAAPLFRPLPHVLATAKQILTEAAGRSEWYEVNRRITRYGVVMRGVLKAVIDRGNAAADLAVVAENLAVTALELAEARDEAEAEDSEGESAYRTYLRDGAATVSDLRLRALKALRAAAPDARDDADATRQLLDILDTPLFIETVLSAAEALQRLGQNGASVGALERLDLNQALTVTAFSYSGERDTLTMHLRYWRLRYLHAAQEGDHDFLAVTTPPSASTPAGDSAAPGAPVHGDTEAIELAARLDHAVLALARVDAATLAGEPFEVQDAWDALQPLLHVFRPPTRSRSSASLGAIGTQKPAFMGLLVDVAVRHSDTLSERLSAALAKAFNAQPERWPPSLRLRLARRFRRGGLAVPWQDDALAAVLEAATEADAYTRLQETADLVRRHASYGDPAEARQLALSLVPMSFAVGYRKDYQFDQWVGLLTRALAEPGGAVFLPEAAWLAQTLVAANPMTEGAPGEAAARLPAAVSAVDQHAAVRLFAYLVGHGTVDHVETLAMLVGALIRNMESTDGEAFGLAVDLTTEVIAPAGAKAYPDLGAALATAAVRVHGHEAAADIMEEIHARLEVVALATTRPLWAKALGLSSSPVQDKRDDSSDYDALLLNDGRRIRRRDVPSLANSTNTITTLRTSEASDSSYPWAQLLASRNLRRGDVEALLPLFRDDSQRSLETRAVLAEHAAHQGEYDIARPLAAEAFQAIAANSWSSMWGGARRRAASALVRAGDRGDQVVVCRNLADHAINDPYFVGTVMHELADILEAVTPGAPPSAAWPEVRQHLNGIAATLTLPQDDPFADRGPRWWARMPAIPASAATATSAPARSNAAALADLTALHLTHPAWVARDGAVIILARALSRGSAAAAHAIAHVAAIADTDDALEYAGRAVAAARTPESPLPTALEALERALARHPSQVLRNLAKSPEASRRPLPARYRLVLPPSTGHLIGRPSTLPEFYLDQYEALARHTGLPEASLLAATEGYALAEIAKLPDNRSVRAALENAHLRHHYPHAAIWASRAAFGRVLADLQDSSLLDDLPWRARQLFETVDIDLLTRAPEPRPALLPPAPPAGHDQTAVRWLAEIEQRADEWATSMFSGVGEVLGATGTLSVLNWGHLQEEVDCGTVAGDHLDADQEVNLVPVFPLRAHELLEPVAPWHPQPGDALLVRNRAYTFLQESAQWLSFRPDIAAALGWVTDHQCPGRWFTAAGDVAISMAWWVDGWWTHHTRAFDDTAAQGHAVLLSPSGAVELKALTGPLTRRLTLTRRGTDDGRNVGPVTSVRSSHLE